MLGSRRLCKLVNPGVSIDVFLLGCGLVGAELVKQLEKQQAWLEKRNIKLNLYGVANSRKLLLDKEGVSFTNWQGQLADSEQSFDIATLEKFVKQNHLINPVIDSAYDLIFRSFQPSHKLWGLHYWAVKPPPTLVVYQFRDPLVQFDREGVEENFVYLYV